MHKDIADVAKMIAPKLVKEAKKTGAIMSPDSIVMAVASRHEELSNYCAEHMANEIFEMIKRDTIKEVKIRGKKK